MDNTARDGGNLSALAEAVDLHPLAERLLHALYRHRRLVSEAGDCAAQPCARCLTQQLPKVLRALRAGEPLHFILPAFPAKSPNPRKTLGPLPDKAEELGLQYLGGICEELRALYPPGARITICSDGRVFNDLVAVPDTHVTAYVQELRELLIRLGLHMIDHFDLEDVFEAAPFDVMRERLTTRYAEPLERLKERTRTEESHRRLFNGIHRFLFEDRLVLEPGKSRNQVRQDSKELAYLVVLRSNAWSRLIAEQFPHALRLSIHPQEPHAEKIGILLSKASDVWLTPWHSVALEERGTFRLVKRHEAEALGSQLVTRGERPSHFVLPSPSQETA